MKFRTRSQREQEGDCVSAQWFEDIRSALKREARVGLEEAMANSLADDGWTKEQWEIPAAVRFGRSGGGPSQCNATRQGMRPKSVGKGTCCGERVGINGDDSRCQAGTPLDWEDWNETAAGRGGDQWDGTPLHTN